MRLARLAAAAVTGSWRRHGRGHRRTGWPTARRSGRARCAPTTARSCATDSRGCRRSRSTGDSSPRPRSLSESTLDYLTRTDGWDHVAIGAELGDDGRGHELRHRHRALRAPAGESRQGGSGGGGHRRDAAPRRRPPPAAASSSGRRARASVTTFVCYVLPSNEPVKSLLHDAGRRGHRRLEEGVLTYELTLPEATADERDATPMYRLFRLAAEGLRVIFRRVPGSDPDERAE